MSLEDSVRNQAHGNLTSFRRADKTNMDKTLDSGFSNMTGANYIPNLSAIVQGIENFKVYEDDVWIVTQPKSGTDRNLLFRGSTCYSYKILHPV